MATCIAFWRVRRPAKTSARGARLGRRPRAAAEPGSGRRAAGRPRGPSRGRSRRGTRSARPVSGRGGAPSVRAALQRRQPPAARLLELLERPVEEAPAAGAFVRRVGDELRDEGPACADAGDRGRGVRRRRVDDVGGARGAARARSVSSPYRSGNGRRRRSPSTAHGRSVGGADAIVTTCTAWPRSLRNRASSGPCVAGPPTSGGQIPGRTVMRIGRRSGRPVTARGPLSRA